MAELSLVTHPDSDRAHIGQSYAIAVAVDNFLARRRALKVFDSFHFDCAWPVSRLTLHEHDVGRPNADNVEDAQRGGGAGAGIATGF